MKKPSPSQRVFSYLGPRLKTFFVGVTLDSLVLAGTAVLQALVLKDFMNALVAGQWDKVLVSAALVAAVLLFNAIAHPLFWRWFMDCGPVATYEIRQHTMQKVIGRPQGFFEAGHSGDLVSRINSDVAAMQSVFDARFRRFLTPVIHSVLISIAMFVLDPLFAVVLVVVNVATSSLNLLFRKPVKAFSGQVQKASGGLTSRAVDLLAGIACLRIFPMGERLYRRFEQENDAVAQNQTKRAFLEGALAAMNSVLGHLSTLTALFLGAWLVSQKSMDIGTLMAFVSLQADLGRSFLEAAQYFPTVQKAFAGADRIFELIDGEPEAERHVYAPEDNSAEVGFHGVSFAYSEGKPVLRSIDFVVQRGQTAALVGESGGGKTTILKLLLGFQKAQAGALTFRGRPYGEMTLEEIRRQCAWVPQDPYLFDGTIEENIRFGREDATHDEVVAAAAGANALEFIEKIPGRFAARVGQGGLRLSGGQKQRIVLARAILKDAPILLLDEATSSLDSRSEQLVQEALARLMKGRTSIVVAHRLSTVLNADVIFVVDGGRIVDSGTHEQLLARDGVYPRLWQRLQG